PRASTPRSRLVPYTTLFRSQVAARAAETWQLARTIRELSTRTLEELRELVSVLRAPDADYDVQPGLRELPTLVRRCGVDVSLSVDRKSTRLNSSHQIISYAV